MYAGHMTKITEPDWLIKAVRLSLTRPMSVTHCVILDQYLGTFRESLQCLGVANEGARPSKSQNET